VNYCRPPSAEISLTGFLGVLAAIVTTALLLTLVLRWFGKFSHVS
jgi:predicted PurR-regulated permease PerM